MMTLSKHWMGALTIFSLGIIRVDTYIPERRLMAVMTTAFLTTSTDRPLGRLSDQLGVRRSLFPI